MNGYGLDSAAVAEQVVVINSMTPDQAEVVLHLVRKVYALVQAVGESSDYRIGGLEPKRSCLLQVLEHAALSRVLEGHPVDVHQRETRW